MHRGDMADNSDIDGWSVISGERPRCKSKPNPKPAPAYRFSLDQPRSQWTGHVPQYQSSGSPAPIRDFARLDSISTQSQSWGLAAPTRIPTIPRSLQTSVALDDDPVMQTEGISLSRGSQHPGTERPLRFQGVSRAQ